MKEEKAGRKLEQHSHANLLGRSGHDRTYNQGCPRLLGLPLHAEHRFLEELTKVSEVGSAPGSVRMRDKYWA
jgi:hypothetical protein